MVPPQQVWPAMQHWVPQQKSRAPGSQTVVPPQQVWVPVKVTQVPPQQVCPRVQQTPVGLASAMQQTPARATQLLLVVQGVTTEMMGEKACWLDERSVPTTAAPTSVPRVRRRARRRDMG